jgi:peptidoglycan/LPS O-acetylase OafA/YrhL
VTTVTRVRVEPAEVTWRHVPALDGLRAFAVVAVLLFHGGYLEGGFLGVDLFFALSGFLITSLLIRDADGGGVGLTTFWGRRFRRLLPAAFTMIAVAALWALVFGSAADLDGVRRDGPWAVVYMANWHLIAESGGYWASFSQPSMFDHLWSLAIEEQFYVLWPLAVLVVWRVARRPQRALALTCAIGVVASFVTMLVLYDGGDPTRVYMGTDTRAASLLVGAVAATAPVRGVVRGLVSWLGRRFDLVVAALGAGIVASWAMIDGASSGGLYRGGLLVHSTACALLVVLVASVPAETVSTRLLGLRPLLWIGALSYGLYLWHWPIYVVVTPERMGFDGIGLLVLRIALSFAAAMLSFRFVENPIRFRAVWARGRRGAAVLVAAVVGLLAFLLLLPEPETEIAQFDPTSVGSELPTIDEPATPGPAGDEPAGDDGAVVAPTPTVERPATTAPSAVPADDAAEPDGSTPPTTTEPPPPRETIGTVLWAGDSVAYDMAPGVEAALAGTGVGIDLRGAFYGTAVTKDDGSLRLSNRITEKLADRPADTLVMLISTWDVVADSDDYRAALVETIDAVELAGVERTIIVSSPPVADAGVDVELDRLSRVAAALADDDERVWFIDAAAAWAEPPVLDRNGDGAPERKRDLIHVCPAGAAAFGAWLTDELAARFDGIVPVDDVSSWAAGPWTTDPRYDEPVGSCAPVS